MAQGDAFTRGGFTNIDGAASRPASLISSTPRGYAPEVVFIFPGREVADKFWSGEPPFDIRHRLSGGRLRN
jgi:hypothetical protein